MWRSRSNRDRKSVVCIACGDSLLRSDAREYDKEGDRWERQGKRFEYLCKGCYRELTHQPRKGLEELLTDLETAVSAEGESREEFLQRYLDEVERRTRGPEY